jgi:hypothetical protein
MKKQNILAEIAGWYGTIAILLAYALVSFGVVSSDSAAFQLLNLTGAMGIIVIAVNKKVMQSVILNLFWAVVALIALVNIIL